MLKFGDEPNILSKILPSKFKDHNLSAIYQIGRLPNDNGLRKVLNGLDPAELRAGFAHSSGIVHEFSERG